MGANLLIVEDDLNLGSILKEYLGMKGYETTLVRDGEAGFKAFKEGRFDMCLLDVMMPKKDGFTLATDIRKLDAQVPIIFLTAKSMQQDTIEGLKRGADDYIVKPFSMEELILRIQAVLRRTQEPQQGAAQASPTYTIGQFVFDSQQQKLIFNGHTRDLTTREAALLTMLCQRMNQTLLRSTALKEIWGDDSYFNARSMDVYIAKLRKMLKDDANVRILTVHGQGFKLVKVENEA